MGERKGALKTKSYITIPEPQAKRNFAWEKRKNERKEKKWVKEKVR